MGRWSWAVLGSAALGVCASAAPADVPEELLLDVGVAVFASGGAVGHPEIRRAEANYMAYHVKGALEATGRWGAVRVVPRQSLAIDLGIEASIVHSDGTVLAFRARAVDASGALWLEQEYRAGAASGAYDDLAGEEPFQQAYAALARDLSARLDAAGAGELRRIRRIAELRFARSLAPDAFAKHLQPTPGGEFALRRLPAEDDPMLARVRDIRAREGMFIDTLDEYYRDFSAKMRLPYRNWRRTTFDGAIAREKLEKEANARLLLGSASIVAGLALAEDDAASSRMSLTSIVNGASMVKSARDRSATIEIHAERLRELGAAAEAVIAPHAIELENRTHRLQGSVATQFDNMRRILREAYREESGLPAAGPPPATPAERRAVPARDAPMDDAPPPETVEPVLPPVADDVYEGLADAEQRIAAGDAEGAIATLRALAAGPPRRNRFELAQTHYLLGVAHFEAGDRAGAIDAFERVVAQGDAASRELLVIAHLNLAHLFVAAENYDAAMEHLRPGMAKADVVDAACSAVCSVEARRKAASDAAKRSGRRGMRSGLERQYLAIVNARQLLRAEEYDEAIAFLNDTLDITFGASERATLLGLLATAHIRKQDYDAAIEIYEGVLARPDSMPHGHKVGALHNLAQLHFIQGDYEESLRYQMDWLEQSNLVIQACPQACGKLALKDRRRGARVIGGRLRR